MSALRQVSRVINRQSLNVITKRSYAAERNLDEMTLTLAGANQVFYDAKTVKQVDVPSFSGSFGILPRHVPTLAVLKPGVVTVFENEGKVNKVFVSSGTVTINDDSTVQILAEEAHSLDALDGNACREILSKAQSELNAASSEMAKAEANIAVEVAEELVRATGS